MALSECEFSELLYRAQVDVKLLSKKELDALQEHLGQDEPCLICAREIKENKRFLKIRERVVREWIAQEERGEGPLAEDHISPDETKS